MTSAARPSPSASTAVSAHRALPRLHVEERLKAGSARALESLERAPRSTVLLAAALLLGAIAAADALTPVALSFAVFHVVPVFIASWRAGRRTGLAFAAAAAFSWFAADTLMPARPPELRVVVWDLATKVLFFTVVSELVAALRGAMERLRDEARTDPLTGLLNRRAFYERAEEEIARARRSGLPLVVAYLDVDGFKEVNDRLGHETGDAVLVALARGLTGHVRSGDVVARLGGDEFAVLFPNADTASAAAIAAQLETAVAGELGTIGAPVGFSVGLAARTAAHACVDDLLRSADAGMYRAKALRRRRATDCPGT